MISKRELEQLRGEWTLDIGVIEKDYVLGWLLAGIGRHPALADTWVFKGGTCLRKCYYETFRFSEDLDFTVMPGGIDDPTDLRDVFGEIAGWLREESGIQLTVDDTAFRRRRNRRGNPTTQGRLAYQGPNPQPVSPKVKLDITTDEVLVQQPVLRKIGHQYSDAPLPIDGVRCYSITELFGEKLRALSERCRPRDLYDVVHMHRHPDLIGMEHAVTAVLERKCSHAGIDVPDVDSIRSSPFRDEIEAEWENMLGHQLPRPLPPFADFWMTLDDVFRWLAGTRPTIQLPRASLGDLDPGWEAPRAITSWRRGVPLELLRYAGANRLKVDIDYRAENGRWGSRRVEPYSLRRTQDGNLVLFVVNDQGALRSYRVDRIAGVRPTTTTFTPRFRVEF
ncbi:MAG: nucleotidyl transferase AbiEii/AbiGii toxin family protein [Streptosporangiaceae bacterium]